MFSNDFQLLLIWSTYHWYVICMEHQIYFNVNVHWPFWKHNSILQISSNLSLIDQIRVRKIFSCINIKKNIYRKKLSEYKVVFITFVWHVKIIKCRLWLSWNVFLLLVTWFFTYENSNDTENITSRWIPNISLQYFYVGCIDK